MTVPLPDVALSETSDLLIPLNWVGMQGIDLPILLDEAANAWPTPAQVDVQVDLPDPAIKGIHMSRLYRLLEPLSGPRALTPTRLREVLAAMVDSHADCQSTRARVRIGLKLLSHRPALLTPGLGGWKAYPVVLQAQWQGGRLHVQAQVEVEYSSTCPCSAALARQLVERAFTDAFADSPYASTAAVAEWLRSHATLATPHSQRSVARVTVDIDEHAAGFALPSLIERIEAALGTPVQTAVKRADEQEFARLNGQNLMYVEDAARRLHQALAQPYPQAKVFVAHRESLHPHDAVAWSGGSA